MNHVDEKSSAGAAVVTAKVATVAAKASAAAPFILGTAAAVWGIKKMADRLET